MTMTYSQKWLCHIVKVTMPLVKSDHDYSQAPVSFNQNFQNFAKCSNCQQNFSQKWLWPIAKSDYDL